MCTVLNNQEARIYLIFFIFCSGVSIKSWSTKDISSENSAAQIKSAIKVSEIGRSLIK